MVRWRFCLVLAMLLLLPTKIGSKEDEEEEERNDDPDDDEEDEDEEDEDDVPEQKTAHSGGRRAPVLVATSPKSVLVTRTSKRRPLECYVCAYKNETPLRACLDPTKYRVHTITCHSSEDKCFTSVISKGTGAYEAVVRGCRSGCVGSPDTTCCEINRCNNQAFAMPVISPRALTQNKTSKTMHPSVFFFVTILLVLQTVVKVAFV